MSKLKVGNDTRRVAKERLEVSDGAMADKAVAVGPGDWRNQLLPDSRHRTVDEIMETLMRHIPYSGREELLELYNMAVSSEENIYTAAACQLDYLRKLSLKMFMIEIDPPVNVLRSNSASSSQNPQDPSCPLTLMTASSNMQVAQRQVQIPDQVMCGGAVAATGVEVSNWRALLHTDSRQRIVRKIMETLKRHLSISEPGGLVELNKIATRFEEKIYASAANQSDYLRKISLKMLTLESICQNPNGV